MDGQDCLSLSPIITFMCVGLYDLTGIKQFKICIQINVTFKYWWIFKEQNELDI